MASGPENNPKDLKVMVDILNLAGITEFEESVLNQMLEFTYRYVTSIIDDAVLYSTHAKKKAVDSGDVKLAIYLQQDKNFSNIPTREVTADLARFRNSVPFPSIRTSAAGRLPPDRHSLTFCNFALKSQTKKPRLSHAISRNVPNSVTPHPRSVVQKTVPGPIIKFTEGNKISVSPQLYNAVSSVPLNAQVSAVNSLGVLNTGPSNGEKRNHEDDDYDN